MFQRGRAGLGLRGPLLYGRVPIGPIRQETVGLRVRNVSFVAYFVFGGMLVCQDLGAKVYQNFVGNNGLRLAFPQGKRSYQPRHALPMAVYNAK